jgi:hypothetical protein
LALPGSAAYLPEFVAFSLHLAFSVRVRLTKKLAEEIDGVNLAGRQVGDVMNLSEKEAKLLLAEEWAQPDRQERRRGHRREQSEAAEWSRRKRR